MLLTYPQLATGSLVQFPARKTYEYRSVVNRLPDGTSIRFSDSDASLCRWELRYSGLSDSERETLEKFFRDVEGRLTSFLFLDPFGNLLAHGDDLKNDVWVKGPLLRVEGDEGLVRVTNTGQAA